MGKNGSGIGKFIAGAAIGAGLALLFAPQDGKTTRKQLKEKFAELAEKVKNIDPEDVKDKIQNKIEEIKNDLADLDGEKVLAIAKDKATKIAKKCDELYTLAKKKATPVIQKAVEDVRISTIKVLNSTVAKLEAAAPEVKKTTAKKTPAKKTTKKKVSA